MPLAAVSSRVASATLSRRGAAIAGVVAIAGALSVATVSNTDTGQKLRQSVSNGVENVKTVAAMLADRSPGERIEGALANLKPKKQAAVHERALPKIRAAAPPSPYATLAGPPPAPAVAPPPETPLYGVVTSPPVAITPTPGGSGSGGPPGLSNIPLPGGGGGGFISPPIPASTPETPPTPVTPVPEPASWAMMLLGFALVARGLRGRHGAALRASTG